MDAQPPAQEHSRFKAGDGLTLQRHEGVGAKGLEGRVWGQEGSRAQGWEHHRLSLQAKVLGRGMARSGLVTGDKPGPALLRRTRTVRRKWRRGGERSKDGFKGDVGGSSPGPQGRRALGWLWGTWDRAEPWAAPGPLAPVGGGDGG